MHQKRPFSHGLLGMKYATGQGVTPDLARAHLWLRLAAAGRTGDRLVRTLQALERVGLRLTPEAQADAEAAADACRLSGFTACGEPE